VSYLLDTCVLSELVKPRPDPSLTGWVADQNEHSLHLSVVTIGELHKGVAMLPTSRRRDDLELWLENELIPRFGGRILAIDLEVARVWGEMLGQASSRGRPLAAVDALIAATGSANDCVVVTRNVTDMEPTGVEVLNPWVE
jgi:predicted nucleic acid-binding protein